MNTRSNARPFCGTLRPSALLEVLDVHSMTKYMSHSARRLESFGIMLLHIMNTISCFF
jgi:hypothetical protein